MTDHTEIEPEMNNLADAEEKEAVNMNGSEMERKRAQLQRAGTMDATALEGISLLHREGVSIDNTVDHLRSGVTFKSPLVEPDSTHVDAAGETPNENETGSGDVEGKANQDENENSDLLGSEPVTSSLNDKETVESKRERLSRTLTMAATMEEAKEILKDEELGKTRSKGPEVIDEVDHAEPEKAEEKPKESKKRASLERTLTMAATLEESKGILSGADLGKTRAQDPQPGPAEPEKAVEKSKESKKRGSLERTLTMAATLEESKGILSGADLGKTRAKDPQPDSSKVEFRSPVRTLSMLATIEESQNVVGNKNLGKTRSQDRKRLLKRSSVSPRTTPSRKSSDGESSAKRKRN